MDSDVLSRTVAGECLVGRCAPYAAQSSLVVENQLLLTNPVLLNRQRTSPQHMMSTTFKLLDLPLELFDAILAEAIQIRGLKRAFRLRLVNRRFMSY
jgi:hypothetical protein